MGRHYRRGPPRLKPCFFCFEPFPYVRWDAKFCSPACRQASRRQSLQPDIESGRKKKKKKKST